MQQCGPTDVHSHALERARDLTAHDGRWVGFSKLRKSRADFCRAWFRRSGELFKHVWGLVRQLYAPSPNPLVSVLPIFEHGACVQSTGDIKSPKRAKSGGGVR